MFVKLKEWECDKKLLSLKVPFFSFCCSLDKKLPKKTLSKSLVSGSPSKNKQYLVHVVYSSQELFAMGKHC